MPRAEFDLVQAQARVAYWQGVRDAQLGEAQQVVRHRHVASYRLGVFHVEAGVIARDPLAAVHAGPLFEEGEEPWMRGMRR